MPVDLTRVKGICFDVDGTISDTDDAWVARLTRAFRSLRFFFKEQDPKNFSRWLVMVTESPMNLAYHWMDALSLDDNIARILESLQRRRKHSDRSFWLMPGADELLHSLSSRFPLAVVSARDHHSTHRFLHQFDLLDLFKEVVTSQTCEHTKPYPHPVLFAARQMIVEPHECLMIGDTTVDILAGRRAGAQTVGLLCGFGTERELRRAGADLILKDLGELQELFRV